jgi:porin
MKNKRALCFIYSTFLALTVNNFTLAEEAVLTVNENSKSAVASESTMKLESNGKIIPVQDFKGIISKEEIKEPVYKLWLKGDYATGDWKGIRTKLEEKGITFGSEYVNDNFIKMTGGLNDKKPFKAEGLINTYIEIDTEKVGLWKGGKLFTNFENLHGKGLTGDYVGDLQTLSNIDAQRHSQLSEYWYEQSLLNEHAKIKVGRQDANADFCTLENAGDFINSSFGLIPTVPIPTYPAPALGVSTIVSPNKYIDLKYGFFDGGSQMGTNAFRTAFDGKDGSVHLAEISLKPEIKGHKGNYIAGYWLHTGDFDEITDAEDVMSLKHNAGFYTAFDQKIFNEKKDKEQGLNIIGQFGWAPADRSEISRYYGTGLKYTGLIPKRDKDITGIATAIACVSDRYKNIDERSHEAVLEVFEKIQITNWLAFQPSMQYIFNTGGGGKNTFAVGIRSIITF